MKTSWFFPALVCAAVLGSGCRTYNFRIAEPPQLAGKVIADQPVAVKLDPLEYRFARHHKRLAVQIINPTQDKIVLLGDQSLVMDPQGESHPLNTRVIGPQSYTRMLLPPEPISAQVVGPYGYGWGGGWYGYHGPGYAGFYDPFYYGPPVTYVEYRTAYDWTWSEGPARLRLSYERNGQKFEHVFEIVRERQK
jgi:hypothetical protein